VRAALAVHAVMLTGALGVVDALVGRARPAQARLARLVRGALRVRAAPSVADRVDAVVAIAAVTVLAAARAPIRRRRRRRRRGRRRRRRAGATIRRRRRGRRRPCAAIGPGPVGSAVRAGWRLGITVVVAAARASATAVGVPVAGLAAHAVDAGLLGAAVPVRGTPLGVRWDIATFAVAAILVGVTVCGVHAVVGLVLAPLPVTSGLGDDASGGEGEYDKGHQPGKAGGGVRHGDLRTRRSGQPSSV
jgi:hypothetical protein